MSLRLREFPNKREIKGSDTTYMDILDMHLAIPEARQFIENFASLLILDGSAYGIIGTGKIALGLEFDIGHEVVLRASNVAVVAKLILHLAEQNTARIHIRLRQDTAIH